MKINLLNADKNERLKVWVVFLQYYNQSIVAQNAFKQYNKQRLIQYIFIRSVYISQDLITIDFNISGLNIGNL